MIIAGITIYAVGLLFTLAMCKAAKSTED